ncbi:unnamed protein product [Caenorhabditis angaria]|uniref:Chitin-binding type-2 domain-containing protein n=1 Tax=Caenorhabditis angaria TaxID=860376 RepID=A0A9P1J5H3_9PELO|nr:unnamed protein product [Caenorhabditis angaria]
MKLLTLFLFPILIFGYHVINNEYKTAAKQSVAGSSVGVISRKPRSPPCREWHRPSCGQFTRCSNGREYVMDCPSGLHFDTRLKICDYPENAKC